MKYEIGKIISQEYQDRRALNAQKLQDEIDKIYSCNPSLKEIDNLLIQENASIVMKIMQDGILQQDSAKKQELIQERKNYLNSNNIPFNFDIIKHTCNICNDTGFANTNRSEHCKCYHQILIPLLLRNSNFNNISKYNFSQFNLEYFSDECDTKRYLSSNSPKKQIEGIRNVSRHFLDCFDEENTKSLFFLGKPGTGKTFLSGCIANELLENGKSVLYLSSPELYENITEYRMLSNSFSPDPERFEKATQIYQSIIKCDLFILDDLGTETIHANRQPELLNILNHRIDSNKKMIISTNLDTASLSTLYDERVLSRIYGSFSVLRFFGEDLRHVIRSKISN